MTSTRRRGRSTPRRTFDRISAAAELTGNVGVQAVHTDQRSTGFKIGNQGTPAILTPASDGAKYWDIMPSMNLSLRFPSDWVIRAGLAREVQRPRMDSMRIANEYGVCQSGCAAFPVITGTAGNPELRPFRANAADLSFEKYWGTKGYISLQLFYKYFDTFVVEQNLANVPFDYTGYPIPAPWQTTNPAGANYLPPQGITGGFIKAPYNVSGGKMYGAELGATLPFGDLVHALDGFGLTGGVGYTQSKVHIYPGAPATALPGYSKWVANGTLYFEKWGFNARGSVRYRSSFQGEVSGFAQNNVFRRSETGNDCRCADRLRFPAQFDAQRPVDLPAGTEPDQRAVRDDQPGPGSSGHRLSAIRAPLDAWSDVQVRGSGSSAAAAAATAASAATSAGGDADLPGRIGDRGDGDVPGAAATASAASAPGNRA